MQDNNHSTHHLYVADHLQREKVKAPRNAGAAVYLPAGLSVQPWRKDGSANKMHLFYEVQPGIHLTRIKGHSSYFSSGIEQRVGVKFSR